MQKNENTFVLAGILFLTTAVVALLLALVNNLTAATIKENDDREQTIARSAVLQSAEDFSAITLSGEQPDMIQSIYEGITDGNLVGYCVSVSPSGFGGPINMIVGVSTEGVVEGVRIVSFSETPGLGSKAQNAEFCNQYRGQGGNGLLKVIKSGTAKENEIVAVSGATVTSKAVTDGVNAAIEAVKNLKGGTVE